MTALLLALLLAADGGTPDAGVRDAGTPDAGVKLGPCRDKQTICFSPLGKCHLPVIDVIDRATVSVDVAIYTLNHAGIVDAIIRAKTVRKLPVRVMLDAAQMKEPREADQLLRLKAAGVPMKRDAHQGIMHTKVVIADGREFVTGSFNFTNNAVLNNNENLLVWDCPKNAVLYQAEFDRLWAVFKEAVVVLPTDGGN